MKDDTLTKEESPIIGTLMERTLHATLKSHYESDKTKHEIRFMGFVADIKNDNGITEIQTRSFNAMRKKLSTFLEHEKVTVVYPAVRNKWLIWVDPHTGEMSEKRKSPIKGGIYDIFRELYRIKQYLTHPNFHLRILPVDIEEYRICTRSIDDPRRSNRFGSTRIERIPVGFGKEIAIDSTEDYKKIIPDGLDGEFTSADFARIAKKSRSLSQTALNVLTFVGAVERIGKNKKSIVYRINK
jgi:hypothetical protein